MNHIRYGIIDMAARGTRIFSPFGFIQECLVKTFEILNFSNKQDFFRLLREPINNEVLNKKIDCCIDYSDISKKIHTFFNSWIKEKNVNK